MWAALRSRTQSLSPYSPFPVIQQWRLGFTGLSRTLCSSVVENFNNINEGSLNLEEVEKILSDVDADDVKVVPINKNCEFADYMVIATGRSPWHVRNIAQALIYKCKQKQRLLKAKRMILPSVEGEEAGKWVVIDSGKLIIHALDEKVRSYYNLEQLWTSGESNQEQSEDLGKAFVKLRRVNNSKKKPAQANAKPNPSCG